MRRSLIFEAVLVLLIIALLAVLYMAVVSRGPDHDWTASGVIVAPSYMSGLMQDGNLLPGYDDGIITADGKNIYAIAGNGSLSWSLGIPGTFPLKTSTGIVDVNLVQAGQLPVVTDVALYKGNIYAILVPEKPAALSGVLMAISGDGRALWNVSFQSSRNDLNLYDMSGFGALEAVSAYNDMIYVYAADGRLYLIDLNGSVLKTISNVGAIPSIDESGNIYTLNGTYRVIDLQAPSPPDFSIKAYAPDGTLRWEKTSRELGIKTALLVGNIGYKEPVYRNGSLFVWSGDGLIVLDRDGNALWSRHLSDAFPTGLGFGDNGTLYLSYYKTQSGSPFITAAENITAMGVMTLAPDGSIVSDRTENGTFYGFFGVHDFPGGICYWDGDLYPADNDRIGRFISDYSVIDYLQTNKGVWDVPLNVDDLITPTAGAFDLKSGERLWQRNLSIVRHDAVLTRDNARALTFDSQYIDWYNTMSPESWYKFESIPQGSKGVKIMAMSDLLVSNGTMYVSTWSYNYEVPAFYNDSRCVYGGGVYALDLNGTLLWSRPLDTRVVGLQERNGTVFFGSGNGKVSAVGAGIVGGIIAAASYIFLRFFAFGTVTRARARLNKNANRSRILSYIRENPGASMFEMTQALMLNMGTVRYHLMILQLNNRIISIKVDEKYVRYFASSGNYGSGDQLVISLMRREPLRKALSVLQERPGLSNLELSRALDAPESSTMRNLKVLVEKGVVIKSLHPDGKITYAINSDYAAHTVYARRILAENDSF